ncbi:hypothetical protein [Amycolatopsis sp. NPDC051372]|uniref:hypothetical protein n=1 Tax=unclassified Amycolatopsis TaxID=2618356 RepID=UPI0034127197
MKRPVGKKQRGEPRWPVVRGTPGDGEPWLPPGPDATPDGGEAAVARLTRRAVEAIVGAIVCVGVLVGGVQALGRAEEAVRGDAATFTASALVVWAGDKYFEVRYQGPGGEYTTVMAQRTEEVRSVGDRIDVTYDEGAPAGAWDAADYEIDPVAATFASALIAVGLAGVPTGLGLAASWWRRRSAVRRTGWRAARFDFGEPGVVRATFGDRTRLRLRPARGLTREYARFGTGRRSGFLAGEGAHMVLLVPGTGAVVVQAVSPRWT